MRNVSYITVSRMYIVWLKSVYKFSQYVKFYFLFCKFLISIKKSTFDILTITDI